MTGVMGRCDPDQTHPRQAVYWEGFSGTGAELGRLEDGYGLGALQFEDAVPGESGERAREGLTRDAGRLGHLLAREGGFEDDAPLGDPSLLGGEIQEHAGHPLRGAVEDEVADEVLQLAGTGGQSSGESDGAFREAAHDLEQVVAEDGVEHAIGEGRGSLALWAAFEGRPQAEHGAVADDAQDLVPGLRTARGTVQLRPSLAHKIDRPGRLTLPVEGGAGPDLQDGGRDRQRLEELLLEALQKLELLQAL